MASTHKTFFNWSTGKDSAFALHKLMREPNYEVGHLVTTINNHYNRVTMHGLRRELLIQQCASIGLPLTTIELDESPSMEDYESTLEKTFKELKTEGYTHAAYGDIFLEDLKVYRENSLKTLDLNPLFPIWKMDTRTIIEEFIADGFKAIIVASDASLLDKSFAGREIDKSFLNDLPANVDPCGENGEFHTFCYDGPIFSYPVPFERGELTYREYDSPQEENKKAGFYFKDILPT